MRVSVMLRVGSSMVLFALVSGVHAMGQEGSPGPYGLMDFSASMKLRPSYQHCLDVAAGTTPGMQDCADDEFAYQDKRLNLIYKRLMSAASPDKRIELRNEERKWIASKESHCALPEDPGQGDVIDSASCVLIETAKRATELELRKEK